MNHKLSSPMKGFSMLEVLVALLVISVGLLGVATLQTKGQQFNYFSYVRTQSTYLAYDLMERMRTNLDAAEKGDYDLGGSSVTPSADSKCEGSSNSNVAKCDFSQLAQDDLATWLNLVQNTLPEGSAQVIWDSTRKEYTITLEWDQGGDEPKTQPWVMKL